MDLDKANQIADHCGDSLKHYFGETTACIVIFKNDVPHEIGTGINLHHNGTFLISTAAHVVEGVSLENIRICPVSCPKLFQAPFSEVISDYQRGEGRDLAVLKVKEEESFIGERRWISSDRIDHTFAELDDDPLIIHGYPGDLTKKVKEDLYAFRPLLFITACDKSSDWKNVRNVDRDIEVAYPTQFQDVSGSIRQSMLPDAPGLSGGGLWRINMKSKEIWSPESIRLSGISREWNRSKRYVLCQKAADLWNLINDNF